MGVTKCAIITIQPPGIVIIISARKDNEKEDITTDNTCIQLGKNKHAYDEIHFDLETYIARIRLSIGMDCDLLEVHFG